uniref:4Fe-4S binding domain protein n=1 Tax=uncultured bacterium Contig1450 TaxID=1393427 RepID=W0FHD1_9BACT|nr:4Fe-4S binding domain protein [uncultured bacterium Contig1450]
MMKRKIIKIDEDKCIGCGACASACHEGAIEMVDGKAKLTREDYCDGLGDCLPACPADAISFEEREAPEYNEAAVMEAKQKKMQAEGKSIPHSCPGSQMLTMNRDEVREEETATQKAVSQLAQWPCQIKLVPVNAPFFDKAKLLIAADCTAYAYANMHQDFMKGRITLIGCPKLDDVDYSQKLTEIIKNNDIREVTILRMEVPCCGGLEMAAKKAIQDSGKFLPWHVVTVAIDGTLLQ